MTSRSLTSFRELARELDREWRWSLSEPAVRVTLALMACLTFLAFLAGAQRADQHLDRRLQLIRDNSRQRAFLESAFRVDAETDGNGHLTAKEFERRRQLQMAARSPVLLKSIRGLWHAIPHVSSLAGFSAGATGGWPDSYTHAGISAAQTLTRTVDSNPLLAAMGPFDLTFFVGVLVPLAMIVLTYDLVAADREQGRADLIRAHAQSLSRCMAVRCFVRGTALGLTVLVVALCSVLIHPAAPWETATLENLVAWSIGVCAYIAFWGSVARLIHAMPLSSAGSGLVLVIIWGVMVIAVPAIVEIGTNRGCPVRSQSLLLKTELKAIRDAAHVEESIWRDFQNRHPKAVPRDDVPQQLQILRDIAIERFVRERVLFEHSAWLEDFMAREAILECLQVTSPVLAWRTIADSCAGTSVPRFVEFSRRTQEFHSEFVEYFESLAMSDRDLTRSDIRSMPVFVEAGAPPGLNRPLLIFSVMTLIAWIAGAELLVRRRLSRNATEAL